MARKPSHLMLNPYEEEEDQTQDIVNAVQTPQRIFKPILASDLQIGTSSEFSLPEGWIVEERPRRANPTHVDRYYYEPNTMKQFRSLLAVQRYLSGGREVRRKAKKMKLKKNVTESGEGQESSSMRAVSNFLLEENTTTTISKSPIKSEFGEKRVRDARNDEKSVYKPYSVEKEDIINPMSWKYSIPYGKSVKMDYEKKMKSESSGSSMHNLSTPPPAKVSWVLSGPTGNWNPRVDGSPVPESERCNWSETFVQSIHGNDGPNN